MNTAMIKETELFQGSFNEPYLKHQMSPEYEVQQVLAKYVRAADQLDGAAMSNLFTPDGKIEVYYVSRELCELLFVVSGQEEIANAIFNIVKGHTTDGWIRHTTHDLIIEVRGDHTTIDAQFVRFDPAGDVPVSTGGTEATAGMIAAITVTESGCYQPTLHKINGDWKIVHHRILHDRPFVISKNEGPLQKKVVLPDECGDSLWDEV